MENGDINLQILLLEEKIRLSNERPVLLIDMKDQIIKLVEETFDEEISVTSAETVFGLQSWIEGKEEFLRKLSEKLIEQHLGPQNSED